MCSGMKGEAAAAAQRLHLTCCWCCTLDTPSLVTGRMLPAAPSEPTTWWHKSQRVEAPSPPCGGTWPSARKHKAHGVVAQSPPRGGTKPTKWWHEVHGVVAHSPPRGGTKPTKWWHKVHRVVARSPTSGVTKPTKWWHQIARHEHVVRGVQRAARQRAKQPAINTARGGALG